MAKLIRQITILLALTSMMGPLVDEARTECPTKTGLPPSWCSRPTDTTGPHHHRHAQIPTLPTPAFPQIAIPTLPTSAFPQPGSISVPYLSNNPVPIPDP
jgi:hypothetical protein